MFEEITLSNTPQGVIGLAGHAGIGHVFSFAGAVQEDTYGFSMLAYMLATALKVDSTVTGVEFSEHDTKIVLRSHCGGESSVSFSEGFTPWEADLIRNSAIGQCPLAPQTMTQKILGRIGGHGSHRSASVLCEALAKLVISSFRTAFPDHFLYENDDREDSTGCFLGGVLNFASVPVACLLTVNASRNGTGPNEDTEGNICIGNKKKLMDKLGMSCVPTIVLECKQYHPELCKTLSDESFVVRWNDAFDNPVVGTCLVQALKEEKCHSVVITSAYRRHTDELKFAGAKLATRITELAHAFGEAESAVQKIRIAEQLVTISNKDIGGALFMSNALNNVVGHSGLMPGTAAVLSKAVPASYVQKWKLPFVTEEDMHVAGSVICRAVALLHEQYAPAMQICRARQKLMPEGFFM